MSQSAEQPSTLLTINLSALVENWRILGSTVGSSTCSAVLKANAYGIGITQAGSALYRAGCNSFFVATAEEGAELRSTIGPNAIIMALNGALKENTNSLIEHNIIPVLNSLDQVDLWKNLANKQKSKLFSCIHIDTGMNRLGLSKEDVPKLIKRLERLSNIRISLIMSHLACAEDQENQKNKQQLSSLFRLKKGLPSAKLSIANSSGIFLGSDFHLDMVRPGAALYGINPTPSNVNPMQEVVHLKGKILQVRRIDSPQTVGYGATYLADSPRQIATVAIGYGDGYLRSLSNRGVGVLGGIRVPVVGRVSMDLLTLDITNANPEYSKPGEWVSFIGGGISLDEIAYNAGTIGYEILTALGNRYSREYVDETAAL